MSDSTVADELAIRGLVARYCQAIQTSDQAAWADTFAEDGEWTVVGRKATGRDEALALFRELVGDSWVRQTATDGVIEVQGDEGKGQWLVHEFVKMSGGQVLMNLGIYRDAYVRCADGAWRFASRSFRAVYMGPPDLSGNTLPLPEDY